MQNLFSLNFPNVGFVGCDLTNLEFGPILAEVNAIQSDFSSAESMNRALVGNIKHEYKIVDNHNHLEGLAKDLVEMYSKAFNFKVPARDNLYLIGSWVNFQRKHEFNPVHNHDGLFTFVLYVKIPYTNEEEKQATSYVPADRNIAGGFTFHYTDALGKITPWQIPTDNTYEKRMILFPAGINHSVSPFYSSDEYRVSISGNLHLK